MVSKAVLLLLEITILNLASAQRVSPEETSLASPRYTRETLQRDCFPYLQPKTAWCYHAYYVRRSTGGSWWSTTKYYSERRTRLGCCSGYGGSNCQAMCHGVASIRACNRLEGRVIHKNGQVIGCSGGACFMPNRCDLCNTGYYPDNSQGYCRACKPIDHCNIPRCTYGTYSVCSWCDGEVIHNKSGHYAYTYHVDPTKCLKSCSWRQDTRCYPGLCNRDMLYPSQCTCADGFEGSDCKTFSNSAIKDKLTINSPDMTLTSDTKLVLPDPQYPDRKIWTNKVDWSMVKLEVPVSFAAPAIDQESMIKQTYIDFKKTKIGIINVIVDAVLTRGNESRNWQNIEDCNYAASCTLRKNVTVRSTPWDGILQGGYPQPFFHLDTIDIDISLTNGGTVFYYNREADDRSEFYKINGKTATRRLELEFDLYTPVHCMEDTQPCDIQPLVTPDYVDQMVFDVTWSGWDDENSGLRLFQFEVFLLKILDRESGLLESDGTLSYTTEVDAIEAVASLNVSRPGPYAVEMSAVDWAGNHKSTRRIFIFDDESVVDITGEPPFVVTADTLTNHEWINKDADYIEVTWPDRFINERHFVNGWLNEVAATDHIPKDLEDTPGMSDRSTATVHNIQAIVKFTVGYKISYGFNIPDDYIDPVNVVGDFFDEQRIFIYETFIDGIQLTFFIRGYDVIGTYAEDTTTVTIDLSPPVIQDMWLTRGDILNITVHNVEELNKLTIEWEAFDIHSGLHTITWRIFDNYKKSDVLHGSSHETTQGETQTLNECEEKYASHARGPRCYCTPFNGCFHKHYQIKPQISLTDDKGIISGMDTGLHESDYFIEVRAVNNALLETVSVIKVTIDTSPPHTGSVHDGFPDQPEVDFQQSRDLTSYWDGFFDKESGVWFYVYGYGSECLPSSEFDLDQSTANASQMLIETYSPYGWLTAPRSGTYYVTVVAFNHALDHSDPVCSDGVTIDDTEADVSEVVVKGSVTREGLIKDATNRVWFLRKDRVRMEVINPSPHCINSATLLTDNMITALPLLRHMNGTEKVATSDICLQHDGVHDYMMSFVTTDDHLDISWNISHSSVSIHNFEVGLSSGNSTPDLMDFVSSRQHQHIRLHHPNIWDGEEFFVIIKAITKAAVSKETSIGPFTVDISKPDFQGNINEDVEQVTDGHLLVVGWQPDDFTDHGDPAPLIYQVAIGSVKFGHDVMPFQRLTPGGSCTNYITCTAINTNRLKWHLHGDQSYYVTVKATNTVGMSTLASSDEYIHNVELPTSGVVYDVDIDNDILLQDIVDIDFQTRRDRLTARWSGFHHPHANVMFTVCVWVTNASEPITCEDVGQNNEHTFSALTLTPFETYTQEVRAITEAGDVTMSSDGVTVVTEGSALPGIIVNDGPECSSTLDTGIDENSSHHSDDKRLPCQDDINYQASINNIQAHWTVPETFRKYTPDVYWAIEERAPVADIWSDFRPFDHLKTSHHLSVSDVSLMSGRSYRVMLKFCASSQYCFKPVNSNGFTVLSQPPTPGSLAVSHDYITNTVNVEVTRFYDPDIEDPGDARQAVQNYEWAFTDNSAHGRLVAQWETLNLTDIIQGDVMQFSVPVSPNISFTKCWKLAVRGYNKVGMSSVATKEIKNCTDVIEVRPHVIIDAIGEPVYSNDAQRTIHEGQPVVMSENSIWTQADKDYTTYSNILSAVWPTLRYPRYTWAVLELQTEDPIVFYDNSGFIISDPCNHPDAILCGTSEREYMNAMFSNDGLVHGKRYIVCVHANATNLHFEKWDQDLDELHACSDGITVDLTPPTPSAVWIGKNMDEKYQSSSSCLTVNWQSFIDVEEEGHSAHVSGVANYQVAVGSAHGGVDIVDFVTVGLTNHHMFHDLQLQNGHSYFATVKATDFTGQSSMKVSRPVLVDTTPPLLTTGQSIQLPSRHITDTASVSACWRDVFLDPESGLSHFEWSVGSQRGYDDIMLYRRTEDDCGESDNSDSLYLLEGHAYFVSVKAYNHAGHYTPAVSWAFTVEASPPTAGHVFDGPRPHDASFSDEDFGTSTSKIYAHWSEFYEVHGSVKDYFISIGSCIGCDDVMSRQAVGIIYDIVLDNLHMSEGQKYYVTVTACNTVDMCTSSTSDGIIVDTTSPNPGHVMDGTEGKDIQYQASRLFLGAKWFGFTDPQSGISHYVWRVGTAPGADDILPATQVHKLQEAFVVDITAVTGQKLPVGKNMYVTVRAYNRAGMFSESTSNGFIIDTSGPVFSRNMSMPTIGSIIPGTSVLPHLIRVEWSVSDDETYIDEQYMSIASHIGGDFNTSSLKLPGIVRDYTLTDLDLHDGSIYTVTLVSCNGARICSETILEDLLVDSSPPTPGMFAINTDHSAALDRQPEDWMTWTVPFIRLAWLGFQDVHSGIDHYLINIGSTYMGSDLLLTSEPHVVPHNITENSTEKDEGVVQTEQIWTKSLAKYRAVFVSIWAVNGVGLSSPIIHQEFELAFGGSMELVRRCNAHTCFGHCVCAPHGELCHSTKLCHDVTNDNGNYLISTKDFINLRFPDESSVISHSPTQTLSAAKWSVIKEQGKSPLWYEWSIGETVYDTPTGVFDVTKDRIWHDAGENTDWIITHTKDKYLQEKKKYSFFVRVWYDQDTFAVFKSPGVIIYTTSTNTVSLQGRKVKEIMRIGGKDTDFFDDKTSIIVDWTGRFVTDDSLTNFHLYISTKPGGHDTYTPQKNIPTSVTTFNLTGYRFDPDTVYYSIVQAYNKAGYHIIDWSDGFKIDNREPLPGIVHDGEGLVNIHAINNTNNIPSFWYGFSDQDSGIRSYNVCLSRDTDRLRCKIHPSTNVGLKTHAKLYPDITVPDGTVLYSDVQAFDYVGHSTRPVKSNGVVVDSSPPRRSTDFTYLNNHVQNPSFETDKVDHTVDDIEQLVTCDDGPPPHWLPVDNSCVLTVVAGQDTILPDGQRYVVLTGAMQQEISNLTIGAKYRLTMYSSHIPMKTAMLSSCEGHVKINDEKHVFLLYGKPEISTDNLDSSFTLSWHEHVYYFKAKASEVTLTIGTEGMTNHLALDNILFEERLENNDNVEADMKGHVKARTVFIHDWSSLHAEWNFVDDHSDIVEYIWAIGTIEGGTQLQPFTSVGKRTFAFTSSLHLVHDTTVYVTVIAVNAASLRTVSYSDPILIDLTPPVFKWITDGLLAGEDIDYQRETTISATWNVDDPESYIDLCEWALYTGTGAAMIKDFVEIEDGSMNVTTDIQFSDLIDAMVYVTVKCTNKAGLTSYSRSDGVKIVTSPPSTDTVVLEILGSSFTQYPVHDGYHGNESYVRFRWTGFEDDDAVDSYLIALDGSDVHEEELVAGNTIGFSYASFNNLDLLDGDYTVSVTAINQLDMYSVRQSVEFVVLTTKPELYGSSVQTSWVPSSNTLGITWFNVFVPTPGLYYEVTVSWADGGDGDIVQWEETKDTNLELILSLDDVMTPSILVRVSVRAINPAGKFETAATELYIDNN